MQHGCIVLHRIGGNPVIVTITKNQQLVDCDVTMMIWRAAQLHIVSSHFATATSCHEPMLQIVYFGHNIIVVMTTSQQEWS